MITGHPVVFIMALKRFRNLNSTVPVDVVRVKYYVNGLLNSTRVPVRVSVNKLNPKRILPGLRSQISGLRSYWRVQKLPKFELVKAAYP